MLPYFRIGISQRSMFVTLVLEEVRVDRTDPHPSIGSEADKCLRIDLLAHIPEDMDGYRRADSNQAMNLPRILNLFTYCGCGGWVKEFAKARSCVRKTPGRQLDFEPIQSPGKPFLQIAVSKHIAEISFI
jgi:hypothetical protein